MRVLFEREDAEITHFLPGEEDPIGVEGILGVLNFIFLNEHV